VARLLEAADHLVDRLDIVDDLEVRLVRARALCRVVTVLHVVDGADLVVVRRRRLIGERALLGGFAGALARRAVAPIAAVASAVAVTAPAVTPASLPAVAALAASLASVSAIAPVALGTGSALTLGARSALALGSAAADRRQALGRARLAARLPLGTPVAAAVSTVSAVTAIATIAAISTVTPLAALEAVTAPFAPLLVSPADGTEPARPLAGDPVDAPDGAQLARGRARGLGRDRVAARRGGRRRRRRHRVARVDERPQEVFQGVGLRLDAALRLRLESTDHFGEWNHCGSPCLRRV